MPHSLPVRVRRTEFASSDPDELCEVIERSFGSRLQLAVPRSRDWRAVQLGFRRHLDTTPMAYLRRVRLDHARHDLITADPDSQSVTAIAYRWGFSNASRFATRYQEAYGVRPSHTLNQD